MDYVNFAFLDTPKNNYKKNMLFGLRCFYCSKQKELTNENIMDICNLLKQSSSDFPGDPGDIVLTDASNYKSIEIYPNFYPRQESNFNISLKIKKYLDFMKTCPNYTK